jgi:antibiotic biosynthesis monooxygenase (ABM) superfamily enzyme
MKFQLTVERKENEDLEKWIDRATLPRQEAVMKMELFAGCIDVF